MNMLPTFLKPRPYDGDAFSIPLDLDPDFEEECRKEVEGLTRAPMQTDEERTVEAMENLVTVYTDKGTKIDDEIAALEKSLSDKRAEKQANARLCAWAATALADLKYDPADDAKRSYDLAVEVKRERGDTTWPTRASEQPDKPTKRRSRKAEQAEA